MSANESKSDRFRYDDVIAGVTREDVQAAIDTWDRASEGASGDAEIDAAVDMRDMLEAMLNHGA